MMKTKIANHIALANQTFAALDLETIVIVAREMDACWKRQGIIYTCGNGGSAATAAHFTGDIVKGLSTGKQKRFKSLCVSDNVTAFSALANDFLITFSGSGNSTNIIKAITYAKDMGVVTVSICGFDGGRAKECSDYSIHAVVDDMEVAENVHSVIAHALKRCFMNNE